MKTINFLYEGLDSLTPYLSSGQLNSDSNYFIRVHTSNATKEYAVEIAKTLKHTFPNSHIIGSSASGVISHGHQYPEGNLVIISELDQCQVHTATFSWKDKSAHQVVSEIADTLNERNVKLVHAFCSDHYFDSHNFAAQFHQLCPDISLTGGVAGDVLSLNIPSYVFTPDGIFDSSIVIGAIYGEKLHVYQGVSISHEPISSKNILTKNDGSFWTTVNNEPADTWFREQLGIEHIDAYDDWKSIADNDVLVRFPIILENHNGASRFLRFDPDKKSISQYFSQIPENSEFRIGYVSPSECINDTFRVCNDLMNTPVESIFVYSCLFRRLYLQNCADWEMTPYRHLDISGAFLMGEFAMINGCSEFLNGSCCVVAVAEHEVFIRPDISAFEQMEKIEDEKADSLNFALKRQREYLTQFNEYLLNQLVVQAQEAQAQIYQDPSTKTANYLKFREDAKHHDFDKICMVRIENAELLITHCGHDGYIDILLKTFDEVRKYKSTLPEEEHLFFYTFNSNTFFMTATKTITDKTFIGVCKSLFHRFSFHHGEQPDGLLVSRFAVVCNETNLIECALNTFEANKNTQKHFLVFDYEKSNNVSPLEEFKIIGVLNRAIEHHLIVPYFQGIYDNSKKQITKYEALMRIIDEDGTIYLPGQFMDTAKKYHLYSLLSYEMISKVSHLLKTTPLSTGVNFSIYDIHSEKNREIIFDLLSSVTEPSNIVLEILEDEEFRNIGLLQNFVEQIRSYGAKIAIDDFGSGYSNLLEIASIKPDYIKIDGSIIRQIHQDPMTVKILDIVVYLSEVLETEVIAEYVENQEIQNIIMEKNIRYSQGFLFSKPCPYDLVKEKL